MVASPCHPVWLQPELAHYSKTGEVDCFDSTPFLTWPFFFFFSSFLLSSELIPLQRKNFRHLFPLLLALRFESPTLQFSHLKSKSVRRIVLSFSLFLTPNLMESLYLLFSLSLSCPVFYLRPLNPPIYSSFLTSSLWTTYLLFDSHINSTPPLPYCLHESAFMNPVISVCLSVCLAPFPSLRFIFRPPSHLLRRPTNHFCAFPSARGGRLWGRQCCGRRSGS